MKGIKNTFRLCKIAIKTQPFFLFYGIINTILNIFHLLFPIAIVGILVGIYENDTNKDKFWLIIFVCSLFALGYYLLNIINIILGKYYNRSFRNFKAKFEVMIYEKLKVIDYDMYQSSSFLNDYTKALDEGPWACIRSWWAVADVVSNIVSVATVFTIFAILNPIIIVYAIVVGIIFYFLGKYNAKLSWKLSEIQKQHYRERSYYKRLFYLKDASEDIKTSDIKNMLIDMNDEVGSKVLKNTDIHLSKRGFISFIGNFLTDSIYAFALFFIAYVGLDMKDYTLLTSLIVAATSLSHSVLAMSDSLAELETQSVQGESVFRILDKMGTIEVSGFKDAESISVIRTENLCFSYSDKQVLENINFEIKKGEKIAIVGENGAGKTTFVKLLLRLYDANSGAIYLNNDHYLNIYPMSIRSKIGAVFQDFEAYSFSIGENVLLRRISSKEDEELVVEALKFSGLYDKVKELPNGINTIVTKEFEEDGIIFSGGEKQKLAIARAYAGNYELIILDEPNSALDPLAEASMYDKMMKLGETKTLIFISHRLSTTIKADKIYLFENGKIVESGTHSELMNIKDGKYQFMFNIQASKYIEGSVE